MKLTADEHRETVKRYKHIKPAPLWGGGRCSRACPGTSFICTREPGHRGPHVAHGMFRKILAVWESRVDAPKPAKTRRRAREPVRKPPAAEDPLHKALMKVGHRFLRRFPPLEEILFIALGITMVWFAIDTALHILGWR